MIAASMMIARNRMVGYSGGKGRDEEVGVGMRMLAWHRAMPFWRGMLDFGGTAPTLDPLVGDTLLIDLSKHIYILAVQLFKRAHCIGSHGSWN